MIKKNTKVVFRNGDFQGEYDWKGGIPLSVGEEMSVEVNGKNLVYKLSEKKVTCKSDGEDQVVDVFYALDLV